MVIERHAVCAAANLMEGVELHSRMLEDRGVPPLVALALSDDPSARGEACRCVANLSVNADMHQVRHDTRRCVPMSVNVCVCLCVSVNVCLSLCMPVYNCQCLFMSLFSYFFLLLLRVN